MATDRFTLEGFAQLGDDARRYHNIKTAAGVEEYIRKSIKTETESPEQLRATFAKIFPDMEVGYSASDAKRHRIAHATAVNTYIRLASEYGSIERAQSKDTRYRHMSAVYKPERTQEDIDFNNRLRQCIDTNNYAELGKIYDEHIRNLPTFDPEAIQTLPAEDLPLLFWELNPLYIATQECVSFLKDDRVGAMTMKKNMSKESMERLAEMEKDMEVLSDLKLRCDKMTSPCYPYVDPSKFSPTQKHSDATDVFRSTFPSVDIAVSKFVLSIHNGLDNVRINQHNIVSEMLEKADMDPKQTVLRDFSGKEYTLTTDDDGCAAVFKRDEPLFCTSGDRLKVFKMVGCSIEEIKPKDAIEYCLKTALPDAIKTAGDTLNSDVAAPRWLLTSSVEYRSMQKAHANYKKAVNGQPGVAEQTDEKARDALEALGETAKKYFARKGVKLDEFPTFHEFFFQADKDKVKRMSQRELARMKGAYDMLNTYNGAKGVQKMQQELSGMEGYDKEIPSALGLTEQLEKDNKSILDSALLNDSMGAAVENNTGERLRLEIKNTLTDPHKGLLNKKVFTAQDRQAAEDVLEKAVVLSMIRSGRVVEEPAQIETLYQKNPGSVLDMVRESEVFQKAKGKFITPNGLRKFLSQHREADVNKELYQKSEAKNEMEKQIQPQTQIQAVVSSNEPQQLQSQSNMPSV